VRRRLTLAARVGDLSAAFARHQADDPHCSCADCLTFCAVAVDLSDAVSVAVARAVDRAVVVPTRVGVKSGWLLFEGGV